MPRKNTITKSCYLIGDDYLLIQCGDVLIAEDYFIHGIFSSLPEARLWADQNKITFFSTYKDFEKELLQKKFDYIFSIVNSHIISSEVLHKTQRLAINYHDAPLPRYGGANATGFAILNQEKEHGVTWHIINELIDGGDLLKQALFKIEPEDTALSLNVKSYQLGLLLFKELVKELKNNKFRRIKQNLKNRTYHPLAEKPRSNGWITWNEDAEKIELAMRAFHVGNYRNKFSTLKFKLKNDAFIIIDLKTTSNKSHFSPGTITQLSNNYWQVSTGTNDIILLSIMTVDGEAAPLSVIADKYNIKIGTSLSSPTNSDAISFKNISEKIFKNEYFWVKKFRDFQPAEFPFMQYPHQIIPANKFKILSKINFSNNLLKKIDAIEIKEDNRIDFFLTIWFIYLYKLGNKNNNGASLKYSNNHLDKDCFNEFISQVIPFNVFFEDDISFVDAFNIVKTLRHLVTSKQGYLRDIFLRYPEIEKKKFVTPIVIVIGDTEFVEYSNSLIFNISSDSKELSWLIDVNIAIKMRGICAAMRNISGHFSNLVESVCINKHIKIKDMELLTQKEKNTILSIWSGTKSEYSGENLAHRLFENIARKYPNKKALDFNGCLLTYTELEKKSNQLANYLIENFSVKDQYIIVYIDRSIDLIIAILGILKSGCAYIPIATTSPIKNIELIINDSNPALILTQEKFTNILVSLTTNFKGNILSLDSTWSSISKASNINPRIDSSPNSVAYVIYTSGTTGIPKGVMIKHKGFVNLLLYTVSKLGITNRSRILQFASINFDASVWEIFSTLIAGATLCIPHQQQLLAGNLLKEAIQRYGITCIILPPSLLQTISQYTFPTLKMVVTGGEYCSKELTNHWIKKAKIINAYGPTEATVCVTMATISKHIKASPPIGKPIVNTKVYVLDENFNLLPMGVVGELCIGGDGVSDGYLNKKELSEKYFIADPFSTDGNNKLYRTRDIARWLPNGEIDYIGRIDNQVKIRGFRVELEAIETQIMGYPTIVQCAVVAQENNALGKYLIAYVSCKDKVLAMQKLRDYLRKIIPEYMIPTFFVKLDSLPITNNGKIDREKLPSFDANERMDFSEYKSPNTRIEERLVAIWSELLNINPIGINDNFFSLGGHSLVITNLLIRLLDEFNYNLPLQHFLKSPTISYLAQLIENNEYVYKEIESPKHLFADKILPQEIQPLSEKNTFAKDAILLTGATGFLGAHLLYDLHTKTQAEIYCLIRCESAQNGLNRIQNELDKYQLKIDTFDRIHPICGDLSKPKLALSDEQFDFLSEIISSIYHNGAYVHHLYDYEMLRQSNVSSTMELLELCTSKRNKQLHYVSTLSAITDLHNKDNVTLEKFVDTSLPVPIFMSGYNQTKLISEYLLSQARARNIDINIYRPGWIMGQINTGIMATENNHLLLLLKGCIQLGYAPDWDISLNILPVDFVSQFIVRASSEKKLKNKVYNLSNDSLQIDWSYLINFFNTHGFSLKVISATSWHKKIQAIGRDNALYNLFSLYRNENELQQQMRLISSKISNTNTRDAMQYLNVNISISKNDLLKNYLLFLKSEQFLD